MFQLMMLPQTMMISGLEAWAKTLRAWTGPDLSEPGYTVNTRRYEGVPTSATAEAKTPV